MTAWTWVLIGLCAAGVLLALVPLLVVVRLALRVKARTARLRKARLFTSLEALRLQQAHFQNVAAKAAPLARRAQAAVETIREAVPASGYPQAREAMRSAGAEISELLTELR